MSEPTKAEIQEIFKKLKTKRANQVYTLLLASFTTFVAPVPIPPSMWVTIPLSRMKFLQHCQNISKQ
ncbi:hypothetical protein BKA69DRAFT_1058583 [Paraphysoderma sedebokerense]|nr:hypothetical protein BKA69DRAFT_1058583 [Paraphysoderma sedebokerense]